MLVRKITLDLKQKDVWCFTEKNIYKSLKIWRIRIGVKPLANFKYMFEMFECLAVNAAKFRMDNNCSKVKLFEFYWIL